MLLAVFLLVKEEIQSLKPCKLSAQWAWPPAPGIWKVVKGPQGGQNRQLGPHCSPQGHTLFFCSLLWGLEFLSTSFQTATTCYKLGFFPSPHMRCCKPTSVLWSLRTSTHRPTSQQETSWELVWSLFSWFSTPPLTQVVPSC